MYKNQFSEMMIGLFSVRSKEWISHFGKRFSSSKKGTSSVLKMKKPCMKIETTLYEIFLLGASKTEF